MTDHSDLIERLRKLKVWDDHQSNQSLGDEAADALSSQSLIIKNAALSSGASEIAGRSQLSLSEARAAPEILPDGQDCATALSEAREEIERLTTCLAKANANHEEFERRYYLESDRVEVAEAEIERLKGLVAGIRECPQEAPSVEAVHAKQLEDALRKILWLRPPSFNAPKNKVATQMEIIARDALEGVQS